MTEQWMIVIGFAVFALICSIWLKVKLNKAFYLSLTIGVVVGTVWYFVDHRDGVMVRAMSGFVVSYLGSWLCIAEPKGEERGD